MTTRPLLACHECDLLQRETPLPSNGVLRCCRCRAELYRSHPNSIDRALSFTFTSIVLFVIANAYPIVGLAVNGDIVQTTLIGAVRVLYRDGIWPLAGLVFVTTILMPAVQTVAMAYLLMPLRLRRVPYRADLAFRLLRLAEPWGMTEVLILGLLVALVKLAAISTVVPGIALFSFAILMMLMAAAAASLDTHELWSALGVAR